MKIKVRNIFAFALCPLLVLSCDLNEMKQSFVSADEFYKTKEQCYSGLNSCYYPLKSIYTYTYLIATECTTDLCYISSNTQDAQLDISPAKPLFGSTMWTQCYTGIRNANSVIDGIRRCTTLDEHDYFNLLGEGLIMRALYYYHLTCFFGDVPFYTHDINTVEKLKEVAEYPRMSAVQTRDSLIHELSRVVPQMDQIRSCEVADNRSGAAVGWMLIGKMALWNEEWDVAIDACKHLESIYGSLDQYPLEDLMYRRKNTPERILEIQHSYTAGGLTYVSNCAAICEPSRSGTGFLYDGVEIEELGDQATTWNAMRPNVFYSMGLMPRSSKDLRKNLNLAWEYNGIAFKSVSIRPWPGPKFWCPGMAQLSDDNNYPVFRYADALLMLSEAYCMSDQHEQSIEYLNMIKRRAGIKEYTTFKTTARLLDEIKKERARELFGEFQRKYDLVRWGCWYEDTYAYTDYQQLKNNILPCHRYYPIPDVEVTYSNYALDNKEYEQYSKNQ